jgi:hypothetical protein
VLELQGASGLGGACTFQRALPKLPSIQNSAFRAAIAGVEDEEIGRRHQHEMNGDPRQDQALRSEAAGLQGQDKNQSHRDQRAGEGCERQG